MTVSLDGTWLLATDPRNVGRAERWWEKPRLEAKAVRVPWIIQEAFPGYHGVAWYWRTFSAPANPHPDGRYLLRFRAVYYLADVWVNGTHVGTHEGSEGVFVLDVTAAIREGRNDIAVRVLNPTNEPIDGLSLAVIPRRCKVIPFVAGALYDDGGIVDSVELLVSPAVRVEDLFVRPDPRTGAVHVQATLRNAGSAAVKGTLQLSVSPAASGEVLAVTTLATDLPPGETRVEAVVPIGNPRLWELNDPYLYSLVAQVSAADSGSCAGAATRFGFRTFEFRDGAFRLNGRRIFLKCSHTSTHYPIGQHWPHDPDLARRDLLAAKVMGFNAIRFFCSVPTRYQLDLCDELGFMIYEESFAGWFLTDSAQMAERFDREVRDMITRDRNHPSVVMWGLLNETSDGPVFRHAVAMLPTVRALDETRVVMLNSGRFDLPAGGGSLAGISLWRTDDTQDPNVTHNGTARPITALGITWAPGRLALHPGAKGEHCVLRWTAPADGEVTLAAEFSSIAEKATTDVHILHRGTALFDSFVNLNGKGPAAPYAGQVQARAGDPIDFVVGRGNGNYGGDCTGIDVSIRTAAGATYVAASDFTVKGNPSGPWSYGWLSPTATPDAASFTAYPRGETVTAAPGVGSLANPGSATWENVLSDQHPYKRVPHTASIITELRTASGGGLPVFISEYGIGSGVDLARTTRHFEQLGAAACEDAQWYRQRYDAFMVDWQRWHLEDTFASPEDFFAKGLAKMGEQRLLGLNAIRANPSCVGHSMTGTCDQANCGEGLYTTFRDLKPGTLDAVWDGWYPLRWCLFVEPVQVYRGRPARIEAVLANEDVLKPGDYPVRVQVVGPHALKVLDRALTVTIPDPQGSPEPPFALNAFTAEVPIDGPSGQYRFLVAFQQGAAAAGGEIVFYVTDPADLPAVDTEVFLWGDDAELATWLTEHGIRVRPLPSGTQAGREVILVGSAPAQGAAAAWRELASRIARGSTVIFLSPAVFANGDQRSAWVPLKTKGSVVALPSWLYHKDEWVKRHPIVEGMPAGGLMDYTYYREIISDSAWVGQDVPAEIVAGATNTSIDYSAGLYLTVNDLGAGRFILNTLHIRENLTTNPVAERLLRNLLRYAGREAQEALAELPADFDARLKEMGY